MKELLLIIALTIIMLVGVVGFKYWNYNITKTKCPENQLIVKYVIGIPIEAYCRVDIND